MGPAGQRGGGDEDDEREDEDALAAEQVAKSAVYGQYGGAGEEVGRDGPGDGGAAVRLAGDARQRGGHEALVECGERGGEQQRRQQGGAWEPRPKRSASGARRRGAGLGGRARGPGFGGKEVFVLRCRCPDGPAHVLLPSSRLLRRPVVAFHDNHGQARRFIGEGRPAGLRAGRSGCGGLPCRYENHSNR